MDINNLSNDRPRIFFDGKFQESSSGQSFPHDWPDTGRSDGAIPIASEADVDAAIASAKAAFPAWRATPAVVRSRILLKAVELLRNNNDGLAKIETIDTGRPFAETSVVDIVTGADVLEFYAHLVASGGLNGETTAIREGIWVYTKKEPLGVCAGIGAWNYPMQIALWKAAPCLAAGNTMVYKPSELTPLHVGALAMIFDRAGLPPGVFNVVLGPGSVGQCLTSHRDIAKVSFTGQVSTGKRVAASAAGGMKYVTMELGGKSALVILPDADIDRAADLAMMANFFSSGQVCTNGTRVFVPGSMLADLEGRLLQRMQYIRPGNPLDPQTNFGPMVSAGHRQKVLDYIRVGIERDRARLIHGGLQPPGALPAHLTGGWWVQPTIFSDCHDRMTIVQEEIFGPVMCLLAYQTTDEVIRRANDSPLGLAAGVVTADVSRAHDVADQLQAGIVWINSWGESPAEMSVGGWKQSGLGVENGRRGLDAWLKNKSTLIDMTGSVSSVFIDPTTTTTTTQPT